MANSKRSIDHESSRAFGPPKKRFKAMHLNEDTDSTCSCSNPILDSDESQETGDFGSKYLPELGPQENIYYLQNKMLFDLHVERVKRRNSENMNNMS